MCPHFSPPPLHRYLQHNSLHICSRGCPLILSKQPDIEYANGNIPSLSPWSIFNHGWRLFLGEIPRGYQLETRPKWATGSSWGQCTLAWGLQDSPTVLRLICLNVIGNSWLILTCVRWSKSPEVASDKCMFKGRHCINSSQEVWL